MCYGWRCNATARDPKGGATMHYEYDAVNKALDAQQTHGVGRVTLYLTKGDTAWNPVSDQRDIYGPATVMYERPSDGGVTAYIDGQQ